MSAYATSYVRTNAVSTWTPYPYPLQSKELFPKSKKNRPSANPQRRHPETAAALLPTKELFK